jgi:hypothetical protein
LVVVATLAKEVSGLVLDPGLALEVVALLALVVVA